MCARARVCRGGWGEGGGSDRRSGEAASRTAAAKFIVRTTKHHTAQAQLPECGGAHHAWFYGHVEGTFGEHSRGPACQEELVDGFQFRVPRCVARDDGAVVPACNDAVAWMDEHTADRHLASSQCSLCLPQRELHHRTRRCCCVLCARSLGFRPRSQRPHHRRRHSPQSV